MKVLSAETNLGSATNVGKAAVVRVYNSDSSIATVTRKNAGGDTIGSYNLPADKVIYCQKAYTDTLEGSANLKATAIGYSEMLDIIALGGGSSIVTSDLFLHVDAGNDASYSGSGTTWTDLSGNGNNITLSSSGISYDSSDGDGSIVFDGTDGKGSSSLSIDNIDDDGGSLELWCKITDTSGYRHIAGWRGGNCSFYLLLLFNDGRVEARADGSGSNVDIVTSDYGTSFWANNWSHIVFTLNRSDNKTRFYLNGSLVATSSSTVGAMGSNTSFELMKTAALSSATAAGKLSQVRVYKGKALSLSEVVQNYDHSKSRYGLS